MLISEIVFQKERLRIQLGLAPNEFVALTLVQLQAIASGNLSSPLIQSPAFLAEEELKVEEEPVVEEGGNDDAYDWYMIFRNWPISSRLDHLPTSITGSIAERLDDDTFVAFAIDNSGSHLWAYSCVSAEDASKKAAGNDTLWHSQGYVVGELRKAVANGYHEFAFNEKWEPPEVIEHFQNVWKHIPGEHIYVMHYERVDSISEDSEIRLLNFRRSFHDWTGLGFWKKAEIMEALDRLDEVQSSHD